MIVPKMTPQRLHASGVNFDSSVRVTMPLGKVYPPTIELNTFGSCLLGKPVDILTTPGCCTQPVTFGGCSQAQSHILNPLGGLLLSLVLNQVHKPPFFPRKKKPRGGEKRDKN